MDRGICMLQSMSHKELQNMTEQQSNIKETPVGDNISLRNLEEEYSRQN